MARPHRIWFREQKGYWCVKIGGKQVVLAKGKENKAAAEQRFHEIMAKGARPPESVTARTADVIEAFLRHSRIHFAEDTHKMNRYYGQLLAEACGQIPARDIRPFHIARWIDPKIEAGRWGE